MATEDPRSEPPPPADDQQQQPPASPPLPTRHTAATPGPRAARFQETYSLALSHTLARISEENLAACYPTVAARAPGMLRQVQKQMVDRLRFLCDREFEKILQERNVVPKLNELESLVSDAARRKDETGDERKAPPVPPHLLPADAVLSAHLGPHLTAQQSQLNARLQTVQAHNVRLFEEISAQRAEAEALLAAAERACADVAGASALLEEAGAEDLAREAREVEVEMTGA
ncbi:Nnf1-domain-containing protein [Pleurostoma richardsiae]|uniref:Nnf1-domain-containing protein n=1 Tax=Pleurostoma richardsiae TaxID=41990 RepID=A0AA38RR05_9PEZI|nr:Nnf1-domain-containing protein [Pleurostoma richardsiae]